MEITQLLALVNRTEVMQGIADKLAEAVPAGSIRWSKQGCWLRFIASAKTNAGNGNYWNRNINWNSGGLWGRWPFMSKPTYWISRMLWH